jgi:uncharacterized protein (TIGR03382 family)
MAAATLTLAVSLSAPVFADGADPTVDQIYQAARAGHLDQAQQMIEQVLKDHPKSSKAHYVQAELYAREGKTALARSELGQAEQLDPGLTHENARSVEELKGELGLGSQSTPAPHIGMAPVSSASHFPWGMVLVLVLVVGVLWMLFRRRSSYPQYPAGGAPVMGGGPGTYGGPAGYGGGVPMGGGLGSGIAGGLASGLAVGAGVVAGEELAHHFLDGGAREGGTVVPPAGNDWEQASNSDMGGSDFGVNDSGSWDDSSGGGGGGDGGDWS